MSKRSRAKEIPSKGGDEYDVYSRWRKIISSLKKAGRKSVIRQQFNARARKRAKELAKMKKRDWDYE